MRFLVLLLTALLLIVLPAKASEPMSIEDKTEIILRVMLKQPPSALDKKDTPEQREELYRPVARAIALASQGSLTMAAALVSQSWHETKWARYVLEGRCKDGPPGARCDWNKFRRGPMARGPWQIHNWCKDAWNAVDGSSESYEAGAACEVRLIKYHYKQCKTWEGAFAGSWRSTCSSPTARKRADLMAEVLPDLQRELRKWKEVARQDLAPPSYGTP